MLRTLLSSRRIRHLTTVLLVLGARLGAAGEPPAEGAKKTPAVAAKLDSGRGRRVAGRCEGAALVSVAKAGRGAARVCGFARRDLVKLR